MTSKFNTNPLIRVGVSDTLRRLDLVVRPFCKLKAIPCKTPRFPEAAPPIAKNGCEISTR